MENSKKAKVGDLIKSLHCPDAPERGWMGGTVTEIKVEDGVEYVYFTAKFDARMSKDRRGLDVSQIEDEPCRTPQNGTPSLLFPDGMNHITIVKEA